VKKTASLREKFLNRLHPRYSRMATTKDSGGETKGKHKDGRVGRRLAIKAFKNRTQGALPSEAMRKLWDDNAWLTREGTLEAASAHVRKQYPGHSTYKVKFDDLGKLGAAMGIPEDVVPCKTLCLIRLDGALLSSNFTYDTLSTGAKPVVGGMVLRSTGEEDWKPETKDSGTPGTLTHAYESLPEAVWKQMTSADKKTKVLLKLAKYGDNLSKSKDDVSGELYIYTLAAMYVLYAD
jgi:hypothetical protein